VGGPRSDSNLIWAFKGEYVVDADSIAKYRPIIEAINAQRLAGGGFVGTPAGLGWWLDRKIPVTE
jgi:hypothetical protein